MTTHYLGGGVHGRRQSAGKNGRRRGEMMGIPATFTMFSPVCIWLHSLTSPRLAQQRRYPHMFHLLVPGIGTALSHPVNCHDLVSAARVLAISYVGQKILKSSNMKKSVPRKVKAYCI